VLCGAGVHVRVSGTEGAVATASVHMRILMLADSSTRRCCAGCASVCCLSIIHGIAADFPSRLGGRVPAQSWVHPVLKSRCSLPTTLVLVRHAPASRVRLLASRLGIFVEFDSLLPG